MPIRFRYISLLFAAVLIAMTFTPEGRAAPDASAPVVTDIDFSRIHHEAAEKSIRQLVKQAWGAVKQEHYDSAAALYSIAASRYSESLPPEDVHRCAAASVNMGYIWLAWRMNSAEAYKWLKKADSIAVRHNLRDIQAAGISTIGQIYFDYNNFDRAHDNMADAFHIVAADHDDTYYWRSLLDLTLSSLYAGAPFIDDSTLNVIRRYRQLPDAPMAGYTRSLSRASIMLAEGNPAEAARILADATPALTPEYDRKRYLTLHHLCTAKMWMLAGHYHEASHNLLQATEIAKKEGYFNLLEKAYSDLETCAAHTGDAEAMERYHHNGIEIRDSLFNASLFETVKDLEIADRLAELNLSVHRATERAKTQRRRIWSVTAFALMLIIVTVYIYIKHRRLQDAYREIFKRNMELSEKEAPAIPASASGSPSGESESYANTSATGEAETTMLLRRVKETMASTPEIFSPDFSIERLAQLLDTKEKSISHAINTVTGKNFNSLLSEYRIREACRLLADPATLRSSTMESVALKVGYRSRTHFSSVFKSLTGLTPTQFTRQAREAEKNV